MVKKRVVQTFVLIAAIFMVLAFIQLFNFNGITGFLVRDELISGPDVILDEEVLPDFQVLRYDVEDSALMIDYYPRKYIGSGEDAFLNYSISDSSGEILYSGVEKVDLDVSLKSRFVLRVETLERLPDGFDVELEMVRKGGNVLDKVDFNSLSFVE